MNNYARIAEELLTHFVTKEFPACEKCGNKVEERICFTDKALGLGNRTVPIWQEELSDCVHKAADLVGEDYAYIMVQGALQAISDADPEDEDELLEATQDIEPPCYTSDLMTFYSKSNNHCWLREAAKESGGELCFERGYSMAQDEVSSLVRSMVEGLTEDEE